LLGLPLRLELSPALRFLEPSSRALEGSDPSVTTQVCFHKPTLSLTYDQDILFRSLFFRIVHRCGRRTPIRDKIPDARYPTRKILTLCRLKGQYSSTSPAVTVVGPGAYTTNWMLPTLLTFVLSKSVVFRTKSNTPNVVLYFCPGPLFVAQTILLSSLLL
jgi:hypothetical protein